MIGVKAISIGNILGELSDKFSKYNEALRDFGYKILTSIKVKDFIEIANKKNLALGIKPDGNKIEKIPDERQKSEFYERYTVALKRYKGQEYDFVNLYDTGKFYESLDVKSGSDDIYVISTDPKSELIMKVWGDVLGITQEDLKELIELLRYDFIDFTRKYFKTR